MLASSAGHAATKDLLQAIITSIPWEEKSPDLVQRTQLAQAIQRYWVEFDTRVPRLSPKEKEWIEGEMASQGNRLTRAFNSVEFALYSINQQTDTCLDTIKNVINAQEAGGVHGAEMFHWVKMLNCYDGSGDLMIYLERAAIPYNDDAGEGIQLSYSNFVHNIIVNKVVPSAMAETMGWTIEN